MGVKSRKAKAAGDKLAAYRNRQATGTIAVTNSLSPQSPDLASQLSLENTLLEDFSPSKRNLSLAELELEDEEWTPWDDDDTSLTDDEHDCISLNEETDQFKFMQMLRQGLDLQVRQETEARASSKRQQHYDGHAASTQRAHRSCGRQERRKGTKSIASIFPRISTARHSARSVPMRAISDDDSEELGPKRAATA